MSYVNDWYRDVVNFKDKQTRHFDNLPSTTMQKLFVRLDNTAYVQELEKIVNATPGGAERLRELTSSASYKKQQMKV